MRWLAAGTKGQYRSLLHKGPDMMTPPHIGVRLTETTAVPQLSLGAR
jgi:hypothetical protein